MIYRSFSITVIKWSTITCNHINGFGDNHYTLIHFHMLVILEECVDINIALTIVSFHPTKILALYK